LKTYSENPMQGIPQMKNMNITSKTKKDMYKMPQMMCMQLMYHMMQCMYSLLEMQNMYHMMGMNGMYPMMDMQKMNSMYEMYPMMWTDEKGEMKPVHMKDNKRQSPIPMLINLEQLSPNQIQISYDMDVDVRLGMRPTNYWVQDTMNAIPKGIATLGKNASVNSANSLTGSMVRIESKNGSAKTFILTFNRAIPRGAEYMLIICYVTVKGAPPYSGDNGMATFVGK